MKHSPTPWTVMDDDAIEDGNWPYVPISSGAFLTPAFAEVLHVQPFFNEEYTKAKITDETRANAEFIVRACNAHEELVAAAKYLLSDMRLWGVPTHCVERLSAAIELAEVSQ